MARELAVAGNSVVVMEQGPRLDAPEFEHDELDYRQLSGITDNAATNPQTFRAIAPAPARHRSRPGPA